ncbi:MAG TPA: HD domain-containing phosphohydrolase [Azospirillaceae bacterium]|nr:HD domain-containing phosphohydrolase [Azospirillaceae bacterium]
MSLVEQFVEFIEQAPGQSVRALAARVLAKCRELTRAEAGSVFIIGGGGRKRMLEAAALQNDVVKTSLASFKFPADGGSIAGYVATSGRTLFIDDAYALGADSPYRFNPAFDEKTGFRTGSIMAFALAGYGGKTVGVMQLINRRDADGRASPFAPEHAEMIAPVNAIVGRAIERAVYQERLRESNRKLRDERARVNRLQNETESAFMLSVTLLARAAELHDEDTGNHILRVNEYSYALAQWSGCPRAFCDEIHYSAALHDVGKMSVDQAILHKKARLDTAEWTEMQKHSLYGYEILAASDRLKMAADIAYGHHEKWAGGGYPRGLRGAEIPLAARIVAVADVYDALRSKRPYKPPFSHEKAVEIMTRGDDRINPAEHFDPRLLALFAERHLAFDDIWRRLIDPEPAGAPL